MLTSIRQIHFVTDKNKCIANMWFYQNSTEKKCPIELYNNHSKNNIEIIKVNDRIWKLLTVVDDDVHGARVLITTGGGTVGVWSG